MPNDKELRLAYEILVGERVTDVHWWRTKKALKRHSLAVTEQSLQFLIELRQKVPKSSLGVSGLLDAYSQADKLTKRVKGSIKGVEMINILARFGVLPHRTTIGRWFKKAAGGYKRDRDYQPEEVKSILIDAFLYKAANTGKNIAGKLVYPFKELKYAFSLY